MSESITCRHDLVHIYDRHECDGCCARYILTKPEPVRIVLTKEEFEGLEKLLAEPTKPNEALRKLLKMSPKWN